MGRHLAANKISSKAFLLLLLGGCIVGMGPILAKVINAPAIAIVLYRMMLPIPVLFLLNQFRAKENNPAVSKYSVRKIILMGLIGLLFSLDLITFYISLKYTSVASATLLSNLSPVFIVVGAIIAKRTLSKEIIWPILSMLGLALLCGLQNHVGNNELLGNMIALLAAVFFTGYILLVNKLGSEYNSIDIMLWSSAGGSLFLISICWLFHINLLIGNVTDLIYLFLMAWGTQLIGQTILTAAISNFPPMLSSIGILIDPVAAAIFAWLLLGETLNPAKICGAALILISIYCAYINRLEK